MTCFAAVADPPVVVESSVRNGDVGVPAGEAVLRFTFDQAMRAGSWSIAGGGESFPEAIGPLGYVDDARTLAMPVRLEPGRTYWLGINGGRHRGCVSVDGEPAESYPVRFRTAPEAAESGVMPEPEVRAVLRAAGEAVTGGYAGAVSDRLGLGIDWAGFFDRGSVVSAGLACVDAGELAEVLSVALAAARDDHVWLEQGGVRLATSIDPAVARISSDGVRSRVAELTFRNDVVAGGRLGDSVAYLLIASWARRGADDAAHAALDGLEPGEALVLDVRGNGGGDERIAQRVAGRFIDEPVHYASHRTVDPAAADGLGPVQERWLQPVEPRVEARRVVVLVDPAVMSSNEAFVLMMRAAGATIIGTRTRGSSGNPRPHDLGQGITLWLPSWVAMTPAGEVFEGVGLEPDVLVDAPLEAYRDGDPILDAALERLAAGAE